MRTSAEAQGRSWATVFRVQSLGSEAWDAHRRDSQELSPGFGVQGLGSKAWGAHRRDSQELRSRVRRFSEQATAAPSAAASPPSSAVCDRDRLCSLLAHA